MTTGRPTRRGWLLLLLTLVTAASVQAASPRVETVLPRGAQRGTRATIDLRGQRLGDAETLAFAETGITIESLEVVGPDHVKAVVDIPGDCRLGLHGLRIRTRTGLSNLATLSIGALPEVNEVEPNDDRAAPQVIELDSTVNGVAGSEDVDHYAFEAEAGARVTVEIEGLRLGETLFDPFVAVLDGEGFELASCDDAPLLRQDAMVTVIVPTTGRYTILVRESAYAGTARCRYRLHVGRFPRPTALVPSGGRPGDRITTQLLAAGDPASDPVTAEIELPSMNTLTASAGGWVGPGVAGVFVSDDRGIAPSPNLVRVVDLANVIEPEPNGRVAEAPLFTPPAAVNGVLEAANDRDCFRFAASKGEVLQIDLYARRLRSPLDGVLGIHRFGGKYLVGNDDDGGSPDPALRFTAPEDGEYVVVIRDHLGRGGSDFAYRLEVAPVRPSVHLVAPRERQAVAVPRGGRSAMVLAIERRDTGASLVVNADGLPAGVQVAVPEAPGQLTSIPLVFTADAEAERSHGLAEFSVTSADEHRTPLGGYRQDVEQVLGRNRIVFWAHSVDRLAVAVVDEVPFAIEAATPAAPLVQSGSTSLVVTVTRREGFDGPVRLAVPFAPPGLSAAQTTEVPADKAEATIAINTNGQAAVGDWSIVVTAEADGPEGGVIRVSSGLVPIRVVPPFVAFAPQTATVEQGQAIAMPIEVSRPVADAGAATVELRGLPHHARAEPVSLTPDATAVTFTIETQADSPVGWHRNLFCIARFDRDGAPVIHRLPAGDLRIDKPLPAPAAAAPPPPPPPPPAAGDKPLTRLERLRLERERLRPAAEPMPPAAETEDQP